MLTVDQRHCRAHHFSSPAPIPHNRCGWMALCREVDTVRQSEKPITTQVMPQGRTTSPPSPTVYHLWEDPAAPTLSLHHPSPSQKIISTNVCVSYTDVQVTPRLITTFQHVNIHPSFSIMYSFFDLQSVHIGHPCVVH